MDTKNVIIQNFSRYLLDASNAVSVTSLNLNDNLDENKAIIETLNVLLESVRSQVVLLQRAIDNYNA